MSKTYLGDAVYADFDGHMITLTTEDGIRATNTIHLEPEVWYALTLYVERLKGTLNKVQPEQDNEDHEADAIDRAAAGEE